MASPQGTTDARLPSAPTFIHATAGRNRTILELKSRFAGVIGAEIKHVTPHEEEGKDTEDEGTGP